MLRETDTIESAIAAFPRQLRAARELRNLSQRQLGKLADCSGANISRYEQGQRLESVSLPIVVRLARALRVNLAWLILGEGPRDIDAPIIVVQIDAHTPDRLRQLAHELESGFASTVVSLG